jgi:hypothetical protein
VFKDSINRWVTTGLFKETAGQNKEFVCMTLQEARDKFMECGDILGIDFADQHLGGFQHWKNINASPVLQPIIADWVEELEVRIRSKQIKRIDTLAAEGQFQAAKFLADRGWEKRAAGKPSKEEVQRETKVQAKMKDSFSADIARIKR